MSCFIFLVYYCSNDKCNFVSNNFACLINKYYPVIIQKLSIILLLSVFTGFNCETDICRHVKSWVRDECYVINRNKVNPIFCFLLPVTAYLTLPFGGVRHYYL